VITVAPGKHRRPRRRDEVVAALPAARQRPAPTDPDWPPGGAGPWPQWDGPPPLHPDHPSAPVPRVRAPLAPGAIQEAAEKEAVHLRAVFLSLSRQLSQMSAYITENLADPGGVAATTAPAVVPAQAPAIAPPRPRSRPGAPAARPAGPAAPARPGTAPGKAPQKRGRQQQAMRIAASVTAASFLFAVAAGATELGSHGFKFFVFRQTGTGETGQPDTETDQQFLARQAAAKHATATAGAQRAHTPGRHSAKKTPGQ